MKKDNLYFEIKKYLVFSLLNFLPKSFYALSRWINKLQLIKNINTLDDQIKLISETLNLIFFLFCIYYSNISNSYKSSQYLTNQ